MKSVPPHDRTRIYVSLAGIFGATVSGVACFTLGTIFGFTLDNISSKDQAEQAFKREERIMDISTAEVCRTQFQKNAALQGIDTSLLEPSDVSVNAISTERVPDNVNNWRDTNVIAYEQPYRLCIAYIKPLGRKIEWDQPVLLAPIL